VTAVVSIWAPRYPLMSAGSNGFNGALPIENLRLAPPTVVRSFSKGPASPSRRSSPPTQSSFVRGKSRRPYKTNSPRPVLYESYQAIRYGFSAALPLRPASVRHLGLIFWGRARTIRPTEPPALEISGTYPAQYPGKLRKFLSLIRVDRGHPC